ncbi:hypothetical protein [Thermoleptolyngbya sp. M55_K2018_002]|uniref:hypothetical protein n=1 Tax=Thermoleptolyngbya sp. M55_K2018_002 TaxID=2747808 RepID=UPI0019E671CA|nr:hypothetical protein [Thermoleptolyngbya sp. M55_K2018_002]HIK43014.1 hypothetical protein [Thermoleptolyngbya sp. M55_K2018_002]
MAEFRLLAGLIAAFIIERLPNVDRSTASRKSQDAVLALAGRSAFGVGSLVQHTKLKAIAQIKAK